MVIVVIPLSSIFATRWFLGWVEQACDVIAVLEHQMDMTAGFRGKIANGEAEIGMTFLSEMEEPGIDVVGPLPPEIQMVTPFVAGIPANASHAEAGKAVIDFLTMPEAKRVLKAKGLEPA